MTLNYLIQLSTKEIKCHKISSLGGGPCAYAKPVQLLSDLRVAMELFALCVKLVSADKLLKDMQDMPVQEPAHE